jgi:hypothetical protein
VHEHKQIVAWIDWGVWLASPCPLQCSPSGSRRRISEPVIPERGPGTDCGRECLASSADKRQERTSIIQSTSAQRQRESKGSPSPVQHHDVRRARFFLPVWLPLYCHYPLLAPLQPSTPRTSETTDDPRTDGPSHRRTVRHVITLPATLFLLLVARFLPFAAAVLARFSSETPLSPLKTSALLYPLSILRCARRYRPSSMIAAPAQGA